MNLGVGLIILITKLFCYRNKLLIIGGAISVWEIASYFDLKKAEKEYRELPQDSPSGSSKPYPTDGFF
jgi:hypothetical protein